MCTIVTLGGVLQILGKVTFVHVGGRRKYRKKRVGRISNIVGIYTHHLRIQGNTQLPAALRVDYISG